MENLPAIQEKTGSGKSLQVIKPELPVATCPEVQLRQAMAYGITLSGVSAQNMPSKLETAVLSEFIRNNYPDYTPEEIKYAIEKAMARRFEVDAKCYGNFSCEYIGRILSAYEQWAGEGERTIPPEYGQPRGDAAGIEQAYQRFLNGSPREYYPTSYYNRMKEDKLCRTLPYKLSKRVYQRQLIILKSFNYWAANGSKMLYRRAEELENGEMERSTQEPNGR